MSDYDDDILLIAYQALWWILQILFPRTLGYEKRRQFFCQVVYLTHSMSRSLGFISLLIGWCEKWKFQVEQRHFKWQRIRKTFRVTKCNDVWTAFFFDKFTSNHISQFFHWFPFLLNEPFSNWNFDRLISYYLKSMYFRFLYCFVYQKSTHHHSQIRHNW